MSESIIEQLSVPFPDRALKEREGAFGKMLTYVEAETVIRRLNRVCPQWSFRLTGHEWTDPIEWTDKNGKARSSRTLIVWGELEIPGLGTRSGTGVQVVDERSGEDLIKGALSDCLKNAAKHFNVGIDLYGPDLEAGEIGNAPGTHPAGSGATFPARDMSTSTNTVPDAPKPQARSGVPATERQLKMVGALARSLGMTDAQLHQFAGVAALSDLDRAGVSGLIERLQALEGEAPSAPEPESIVSWTEFWKAARQAGFQTKNDIEPVIGALGPDPNAAMQRLIAWQRDNVHQRALVS